MLLGYFFAVLPPIVLNYSLLVIMLVSQIIPILSNGMLVSHI